MSKLANRITETLIRWCNNGAYDIVVPNWYHGHWEMDVMKITGSQFLIEYEIKVSKSDFKADFQKQKKHWREGATNKHEQIQAGKRGNRFYFVVPKGLITKEEVPKYAGLLYYSEHEWNGKKSGVIETVKNAPILHRNLFTDYKDVATKISFREFYLRQNLRHLKEKSLNIEKL